MRRNRFCAFSAFETKTVGLQCLCLRLYLIELSLLLNIHRASCHFSAKQTSAPCQALFAWDGSEVSCLNSHTATNKIHHYINNNNNNRRLMFYINILCSIWTFFYIEADCTGFQMYWNNAYCCIQHRQCSVWEHLFLCLTRHHESWGLL